MYSFEVTPCWLPRFGCVNSVNRGPSIHGIHGRASLVRETGTPRLRHFRQFLESALQAYTLQPRIAGRACQARRNVLLDARGANGKPVGQRLATSGDLGWVACSSAPRSTDRSGE
jgi:hypothetical protein